MLAVLIGWELWITLGKVPLYLVPPPSKVVVAMFAQGGPLLTQSWVTLQEILLGFLLSVCVALPLSIAIVASRAFEKSVYPLLVASQVVPKVAIAPALHHLVRLRHAAEGTDCLPDRLLPDRHRFGHRPAGRWRSRSSTWLSRWAQASGRCSPRFGCRTRCRACLAVSRLRDVFGHWRNRRRVHRGGPGDRTRAAACERQPRHRDALCRRRLPDDHWRFLIFFIMDVIERLLIPWHVSRRIEHVRGG